MIWVRISLERVADTVTAFLLPLCKVKSTKFFSCHRAFTAAWGGPPQVKPGLARTSVIQAEAARIPANRTWDTGLSARPAPARRTASWDVFVTPKRLHEVVRGPHACLFSRLHLPTSCSNLWGNNLRQGRGADICRVNREGDPRTSSTLLWYPLPSPERWGSDQSVPFN